MRLSSGRETSFTSTTHARLLEVNGPVAVLALLVGPVLTAMVGCSAIRQQRAYSVAGTILLLVSVILGAASIGLFYLPSALLALVVTFARPGRNTQVH